MQQQPTSCTHSGPREMYAIHHYVSLTQHHKATELKREEGGTIETHSHLTGGCGRGAGNDRCVGHLHRQVLVVDERPGALHLARLEVVGERAQVWVAEEAAVGVVGGCGVARQAAFIVAQFWPVAVFYVRQGRQRWDRGLFRGCNWHSCGALLGAVVLVHATVNAMLGQVEGQVASAGPGSPTHAAAVGPQRCAELHIRLRLRTSRSSPEILVAFEDFTL